MPVASASLINEPIGLPNRQHTGNLGIAEPIWRLLLEPGHDPPRERGPLDQPDFLTPPQQAPNVGQDVPHRRRRDVVPFQPQPVAPDVIGPDLPQRHEREERFQVALDPRH
jgi:hypothetical protein